MERGVVVKNSNNNNQGGDGVCSAHPETTTDFVLQWGNRKRLRCMKIQVKADSTTPDHKTTVRVDRRVVRGDEDSSKHTTNNHLNRRRPVPLSPPPPPPTLHHRILSFYIFMFLILMFVFVFLRNSETSSVMKGQINGVRDSFSPEREERAQDKKANTNNNNVGGASASSETAQDSKKGGSSSGSEAIPVWPPKFVIALTNKEKEEDFMAIKGSKLPQRPKKRAKFIQRTVNLVSPGTWLCDLTLERYEVREKKISKKRPRGLKAMGNMDSDSE
ncbi:hypothetical protein HHK36_014258 [Tetracentron sinense]|uniref:Transmembrane protein n=1 Tax=Tetracentron sinense TaxID=13715 RepID=A0A834Z5R3_TETSI|nr:hypothetical protein HHK36_014258 [Tetracentron sinense]